MPFRLARRASKDLDDICTYGVEQWGLVQADRYLDEFWQAACFIGDFPLACRVREDLEGQTRVHRFRSHLIIYALEDDGSVLILRIRHGRSDWIGDPL